MFKARIIQRILYMLPLVFAMFSCNDENQNPKKLPHYVLNRETMIAVLTDVHLIEAAIVQKQAGRLPMPGLAEVYYDSLFKKYSVTRTQLDSSILYYSRNPELLEEIYSVVITSLSKIESEAAFAEEENEPEILEEISNLPRQQ